MKYILLIVYCLATSYAFGEKIGNIEYQLPGQFAQEWEVGNEFKSDEGITLIYIPKGSQMQSATEFFGVNANPYPTKLDNASLKAGLARMFPEMKMELRGLERTKNSVLYEWVAIQNNQEKIHGWIRTFSAKDGTILLGYQTENIPDVQNARQVWVPVLKNATPR